MQVLAILSQKGGSGKSTLAVHLGVEAERRGCPTVIIDLDPQASARLWADRRGTNVPEVVTDHPARLEHVLNTARGNGAALAIVDTAPHADQAALIAARAADLILIPCRPAAFDLAAIRATGDLAEIAKRPALAVLNAAQPRSPTTAEARESITRRGIPCSTVVIHQRAAFSHAVIDGHSAQEFEPGGKAAVELASLFDDLAKHLNLQTRQHAHAQTGQQDDKQTPATLPIR
jgi:chromosome partitioning protein